MKLKKPTTIICLDSLDYEIVDKHFDYFKQKFSGKLEVPILPQDTEPATNVVWTSFSTGKSPEEHKIRYFNVYENPLLNFLYKVIYGNSWMYRLAVKLKLLKLKEKLGLKKKSVSSKQIGRTFLEEYSSKVISLPCYNEDKINFEIRKKLFDVLQNKISEEEYEELLLKAFNSRLKKFEEEINKHELLCIHFFILDAIQHMYYYDENKVIWWYNFVLNKLKPIIEKINGEIYIISDHGQKKGMHTSYGFWSSNSGKIPYSSIIDFHKNLKNKEASKPNSFK